MVFGPAYGAINAIRHSDRYTGHPRLGTMGVGMPPHSAKHICANHSTQSFEDLKKCSPDFTTTLSLNDFMELSSLVHLHWDMSDLTFVFVRGGRTGHIKGRYPHQGSPPPRFIQYHRSAARTAIIRVGGSPDRYERLTASTSGLSFYLTTRPIAQ